MISASICVSKLSIEVPDRRFQLMSRIRSARQVVDELGLTHLNGDLQRYDLRVASSVHTHRYFLNYAFKEYLPRWEHSEMKVIQIHQPCGDGLRVHGTIITDEAMNLVKYCIENDPASFARKNKEIVLAAIRRICTSLSVAAQL